MKRNKLEEARTNKHWTRAIAAEKIGIDLNTLYRWEVGKTTPREYNVLKLCEVYGKTAEDLGFLQPSMIETHEVIHTLEPVLPQNSTILSQVTSAISEVLLSTLDHLGEGQNMDQLRRQLMKEIIEGAGVVLLSPLALPLLDMQQMPSSSVTIEDFLSQSDASIKACWHISKDNGLLIAEGILSSTIPALNKIINQPSKYQRIAAQIGTQANIIYASIAMHKLNFSARETYCLEAIRNGRLSGDNKLHAAALMYLGYTYSFCKPLQPKKAVNTFLEALHVLKDEDALLKSDICMGLADVYAQCSEEKQAHKYIEQAQLQFPMHPEQDASYVYAGCDLSILYQWEGKMYLDLAAHYPNKDYQQRAWNAFEEGENIQSLSAYSNNETIIYHADAARGLEDLELYTKLLREGTQMAISLGSKKRYSEAFEVFKKTPEKWKQEQQIKQLGKDLFRQVPGRI
ncbi:hypothetical protein KDW_20460 [Dictyobacter vulcani]|uniref:HTH cro/C1-type domain-containing protein n=1 Tax=Dictyobacter vulcani TaxID=2607529 RepID=A0A5J4KEW7_9CHLR|nr:helix-turn-helix transcriptional regulator [Dictyobacter vulcani]GER87884.1 hypothetical protein KDW_20460 [Dictyobacter vulcani]